MDSINVVLSQSSYNLLLDLLKIAPTLLEMYKDVAKNGVKTALSDNLDANLETQAEPAFTETNHTDFILNSPGEGKSLRRCDEFVPLNAVFQALGSIQTQISELATQSGYIHNGNRAHLQELVKQINATNNSLNNISNRVQALSKDIADIQTQGKATDASWTNVKAQYSSIDLQLNNGFNESINAIDALRTGVNFKFSDEMADHLGSLTRNSTLTLNSLEDIKKTLANGEYSRKSHGQGNTLNPMYPVSRSDYQKSIVNPLITANNTDPLPTQQTLPIQPLCNLMMEDVFKLADKLDTEGEYSYYLDTEQRTSSSIGILGVQIKANSAIPPEYSLFKESTGIEPDIRIHDMDLVALHNTPHLYAIPPVTGG